MTTTQTNNLARRLNAAMEAHEQARTLLDQDSHEIERVAAALARRPVPREEPPVTQPVKPPLNHLPHGAAEHRTLLLFGLDLANRLGVPIVGIRLADHVGLSIHAECRHAADELADALGLPPEATYSDGGQRLGSYSREGVVDVPGVAWGTVVLVHGPRDWDHWVWTGERSTCACGREIQ